VITVGHGHGHDDDHDHHRAFAGSVRRIGA
jgi:hypothetical protein